MRRASVPIARMAVRDTPPLNVSTSTPCVCPLARFLWIRHSAPCSEECGFSLITSISFYLQDLRNGIPAKCFERDAVRSFSYLVKDVAIVLGLAAVAYTVDR